MGSKDWFNVLSSLIVLVLEPSLLYFQFHQLSIKSLSLPPFFISAPLCAAPRQPLCTSAVLITLATCPGISWRLQEAVMRRSQTSEAETENAPLCNIYIGALVLMLLYCVRAHDLPDPHSRAALNSRSILLSSTAVGASFWSFWGFRGLRVCYCFSTHSLLLRSVSSSDWVEQLYMSSFCSSGPVQPHSGSNRARGGGHCLMLVERLCEGGVGML